MKDLFAAHRLGAGFPLPRDHPFTFEQFLGTGLKRHHLRALCHDGAVRRPIRGVYVGTHVPDSLQLRADCLRLVVPDDCVVVDRHAGWLLGAEMVLAPGEHLHVRPLSIFRPSGHGRLRNALSSSGERNLTDEDVTEAFGVRVTTPIRTAWDLGRVRWTDEAISGLDAILRLGAFELDELLDGVERFRGMRWVTTLRAMAPLADARAESPPESILRLRCHELGLRVTPQLEVLDGGEFVARLDLGDEEDRLGLEYDGREWHHTAEQLARDRVRRDQVRELDYLVEAVSAVEVFHQPQRLESIIFALREAARIRRRRVS